MTVIDNNVGEGDLHCDIDFRKRLAEALGPIGSLSSLFPPTQTAADNPRKILVRSSTGKPIAVVKCAVPFSPNLVQHELQKQEEAREALGEELGKAILAPIVSGYLNSCSYGVLPYCKPVGSGWRGYIPWRRITPGLLRWLRDATTQTVRPTNAQQSERDFQVPLKRIAGDSVMSTEMRKTAEQALARIIQKKWTPAYVLAHYDLWRSNILLDNASSRWLPRPIIIDWGASRIDGHPIYDLVRLARSLRLSARTLHSELLAHARILRCDANIDMMGYLLAALGYLGGNLGEMPQKQFVTSALSCFQVLSQAIG